MSEIFYVVKVGKDLYADSAVYNLYPSSTKYVMNAKKFLDEYSAERFAKKIKGTVVKATIILEEVDV